MEKQANRLEKPDKNEVHNWMFQYIAAVSASLATLTTGTVLGWPSQITGRLLADELEFPIDSDELGWICSCSSLGAALLSLIIGPICDKLGRKTTMLFMIIPMEIGWLLIIFSKNVWMLIFGRIFTGMVGGSFCVTVSLYIDEIAHKEVRGVLGGLTQFMISCGIFVANIAGKFLSVRYFSVVCAAMPILFGLIFINMPETPVYLQMNGRTEDSKNCLRKLLGKRVVDTEFDEIQKFVASDNKTGSLMETLSKKSVKVALVVGIGLAITKVLSGIDAITSYLSHIFDNTDTFMGSQNASILFASFQVFSLVPQALVVDRWGRKILLITSQFAMAVCLTATALCLYLKTEKTNQVLDYTPIVALCLYTVAFSVGIGPIGWIISAEIFEEKIKGRAMSLCTFLVWFLAFANVKVFEVVETASNISVPIFVYGVVSLLAGFFVLLLVPETKNKTFTEIEKALSR